MDKLITSRNQLPQKRPWYCSLWHSNWCEPVEHVKNNPKLGLKYKTIIKCHKCNKKYLDGQWS
jgi:hypothetical protein